MADATNLHRKPLAAIRCRDAARVEVDCDPWQSSLATPERGHGDVSLLLLDASVADHPGPTLRLFLLELRHVRRAAATGQKMQLPVSFLDLRLVERRIAPAGNAPQWLCEGPYLPLKGGGHQHRRVQHNPVLPGLSHPHPKPSAYEASSQPVFLAAKTGRRKIVRGGKDRMLASRPQAVFIYVRGPPPRLALPRNVKFLTIGAGRRRALGPRRR